MIKTDPKISIQRSLRIKKKENRFEKKSKNFHKTVEAGFYNIAQKKNVFEFNGNLNENDLHVKIIDFLNKKKIFNFFLPYAVR